MFFRTVWWSFAIPSYLPWNSSRVLIPSAAFPLLSVKCASIVLYVASNLLMMSISMFRPFLISCVSLESDRSTWISLACFRHCVMGAVKSFARFSCFQWKPLSVILQVLLPWNREPPSGCIFLLLTFHSSRVLRLNITCAAKITTKFTGKLQ